MRGSKSRNNLQLVGLLALEDPPRADSKRLVTGLQDLGVQVIMVSGDNVATAAAVAQRVGIGGRAAPAEVLARLNDGQALEYDSPPSANNGHQASRLARSSANAVLPARVASDIVSKNSDCRTGLLFPAA